MATELTLDQLKAKNAELEAQLKAEQSAHIDTKKELAAAKKSVAVVFDLQPESLDKDQESVKHIRQGHIANGTTFVAEKAIGFEQDHAYRHDVLANRCKAMVTTLLDPEIIGKDFANLPPFDASKSLHVRIEIK